MEYANSPYASPLTAAEASVDARSAFIRRTYAHLAGAIAVFTFIEVILFQLITPRMVFGLLGSSQYSWLIVLGAFMGVSWLAEKWANSDTGTGVQYIGLGVYVVAEALIFLPLLMMAELYSGTEIIARAGLLTLFLFLGLTMIAFSTRKDFSFIGGILKVGFLLALGAIVVGILFGFSLGLWFSVIMLIMAGGSILYTTSNIIHHYNPSQHVAASLSLFASVALMFWYVLRILMSLSRD